MPRHPEDHPELASFARLPLACEPVRAQLEAFVDNELSPVERSGVERHLTGCSACTAEFEEARSLAGALRTLPELACPPEVSRAVLAAARSESAHHGPLATVRAFPGRQRPARSSASSSHPSVLRPTVLRQWRWLGIAAALAVAIGTAFFLQNNLPTGQRYTVATTEAPNPPLTPEELARAEIEVKLALAYLTEVGRDAGAAVRDEMVEHVVAPTHRAFR